MKKDIDSTKVMASLSIPVVVSTSLGYSGRGVFPLKLSCTKETADKLIDMATDIYANEKKNPIVLTMYDTAYGGVIDLPLYINIFPKEFGLCSVAITPYLQEYLDDTLDFDDEIDFGGEDEAFDQMDEDQETITTTEE